MEEDIIYLKRLRELDVGDSEYLDVYICPAELFRRAERDVNEGKKA